MKNNLGVLIGMLAIMSVVGIVIFGKETTVVYENLTQPATEAAVETPAWMQDEDAVKAAEAVVKRKELEAREAELEASIATLEAELTAVQKELGSYWRKPEAIKALIRETFPEDPHTAIAIAHCESGLKPEAYNPKNTNGTTDGGLFQINSAHYGRMEKLGLDVWNPEDNAAFARMLYDESGWRPWVCARKVALR